KTGAHPQPPEACERSQCYGNVSQWRGAVAVLFYTVLTEKLDYASSGSRRSAGPSCKMTFNNELCTFRSPLYSMKPSLRNLFMNELTRDLVVPIISARVSLLI